MSLAMVAFLFVAGFVSGVVNAVAGGGTFITFGALTLAGFPPITANATSSISQFPGYVTSSMAYRADIRTMWRAALVLAGVSMAGALLGALILLALDNPSFGAVVPWLLIAATALFGAAPWLVRPARVEGSSTTQRYVIRGPVVQFLTAIYGGFFGAGMGIMMLATLGLTEGGDYHRLNALKNLLSIVIATVAILVFASGGLVSWIAALAMVPAVGLGGYSGVWAARRVPQSVVRAFVVVVGSSLSAYYFLEG